MLKFFWNGIKENGGALQKCSYVEYTKGEICIYSRTFSKFSKGVEEAFKVTNVCVFGSYSTLKVTPTHPLYSEVKAAVEAKKAHDKKRWAKMGRRGLRK